MTPAKTVIFAVYDACNMAFNGCMKFDKESYKLPTYSELVSFLELDDTNNLRYTQYFNCSWFTNVLVGHAAEEGLALGNIRVRIEGNRILHKMCLVVTKDNEKLKVWLLEPQTDELIEPSKKYQILAGCY